MSNNGGSTILWFMAGLAFGAMVALLAAPRTGKGHEIYVRAKEAKDVAKDAVDVARRGSRLRRPLSET